MLLPHQLNTAAAWAVHDFAQRTLTSNPAGADGKCRVQLDQVPQDELWLIDRIVVSSDSTTDSQVGIYLDAIDPDRSIDGTWWGNFDVADLASAIQLPGGTVLLCEWILASVGAVGTMRLQWQILRRT